jgi:hypothetical protein
MLRHSEYDSSTRRAFLYHAEEAIQAVLCKTKDDQWAVCKYIFNKVRRWNRETAKEMAEKIDQERILKNLDLFDLEKPAEMLPAGMDFQIAVAAKAQREMAEKTAVAVEVEEPKVEEKDIVEAIVKEKEEKEVDEMAPYETETTIIVPLVKPTEEIPKYYIYNDEGVGFGVCNEEGPVMYLAFIKGVDHRWTLEHAVTKAPEVNTEEILAHPDCWKDDECFASALKAKRNREVLEKIEAEKKAKEPEPEIEDEEIEQVLVKDKQADEMAPWVKDEVIYVPASPLSQKTELVHSHYGFDYEKGIHVGMTADPGSEDAQIVYFAFSIEKRWTEEWAAEEAAKIDRAEILENQDCLVEGEKDFLSLLKEKKAKAELEIIKAEEQCKEPEPEIEDKDIEAVLEKEKEEKKKDDFTPYIGAGMIDVPIVSRDKMPATIYGYVYDRERGIHVGLTAGAGTDNTEICEFVFVIEKRWTKEWAVVEAAKIDQTEILENQDCLAGGDKDFLTLLKEKKAKAEIATLETEEEEEPVVDVDEEAVEKALAEERMQVVTKPEETENFIHIPVKDKGLFDPESFRTISISKSEGISAISGKLKSPPEGQSGSMVIQKYLFAKEKGWTMAKAKKWVSDHKKEYDEHMERIIYDVDESLDFMEMLTQKTLEEETEDIEPEEEEATPPEYKSIQEAYEDPETDELTKWQAIIEMLNDRTSPLQDLGEFFDTKHRAFYELDDKVNQLHDLNLFVNEVCEKTGADRQDGLGVIKNVLFKALDDKPGFDIERYRLMLVEAVGEEAAALAIMTKIGAVLNRKNKKRITDAITMLEGVLRDASPAEESPKSVDDGKQESGGKESDVDLDALDQTLQGKKGKSLEDMSKEEIIDSLKEAGEELKQEWGNIVQDKLDKARGKIKF